MNPITLTSFDIFLGLLAAALFGVLAGYLFRGWRERVREGGAGGGPRAARGHTGHVTGSPLVPDPLHPGFGPGGTRRVTSTGPNARPVADPWRDQTPMDVVASTGVDGEAGKGTVLVVDDRMELRAVHSAYLQQHGYGVLTAADGEKALELVRSHHPNVLVLDHSLPGRTGIEVTRELKRDPRTARIPVILMTAHSYGAIGMAAKQAGVAAFLPKPVDPSRLLREVERCARVDVHDA